MVMYFNNPRPYLPYIWHTKIQTHCPVAPSDIRLTECWTEAPELDTSVVLLDSALSDVPEGAAGLVIVEPLSAEWRHGSRKAKRLIMWSWAKTNYFGGRKFIRTTRGNCVYQSWARQTHLYIFKKQMISRQYFIYVKVGVDVSSFLSLLKETFWVVFNFGNSNNSWDGLWYVNSPVAAKSLFANWHEHQHTHSQPNTYPSSHILAS